MIQRNTPNSRLFITLVSKFWNPFSSSWLKNWMDRLYTEEMLSCHLSPVVFSWTPQWSLQPSRSLPEGDRRWRSQSRRPAELDAAAAAGTVSPAGKNMQRQVCLIVLQIRARAKVFEDSLIHVLRIYTVISSWEDKLGANEAVVGSITCREEILLIMAWTSGCFLLI